MDFKVLSKSGNARTGILSTTHGSIKTPVFMPVGTTGTIKALTSKQIEETGSQIILCNTYHLYLRPGEEILKEFEGIHNFMNWQGPILTDSGGFQVLSLQNGLAKVTEEGVNFKSHIDGTSHFITPEKSIQIQKIIGADIIMAFDHISKDETDYTKTRDSMERTLRWLDRCISEWNKNPKDQSLFGIIQGGVSKELRIESTKRTLEKNLPGIAIGGETIGYNKEGTKDILDWIMPEIPENIPRYTMGVGDVDDIFEVVERGVDMFDCVSPTRLGRNGALLISPSEGGKKENRYRLNITRSEYSNDKRPIDNTCTCYTCTTYSRAYLHHLFRSHELLANTLASIHNITFLAILMEEIRKSINENRFQELKTIWVTN